jgi:hypothetical protein
MTKTTTAYEKSAVSLQRHLEDYSTYLERAIAATKILQTVDPQSEKFSDALAELHVSATVLEPYSEGMVEAIDQYTEDLPE